MTEFGIAKENMFEFWDVRLYIVETVMLLYDVNIVYLLSDKLILC